MGWVALGKLQIQDRKSDGINLYRMKIKRVALTK